MLKIYELDISQLTRNIMKKLSFFKSGICKQIVHFEVKCFEFKVKFTNTSGESCNSKRCRIKNSRY